MIISHKYKVIFIHIPKNAGTFVTHILTKIDNDIEIVFHTHDRGKHGHQKLKDISNYIDKYPNYKIFCVVRNIYDRIVSTFNYIKQTPIHHLHDIVKNMTFTEFIDHLKGINYDDNQKIYLVDINNCTKIDTILNFNNISYELFMFLQEIGVNKETLDTINFNEKINPSIHYNYKNYYTKEDIKKVNILFNDDFNFFKIYNEQLIQF